MLVALTCAPPESRFAPAVPEMNSGPPAAVTLTSRGTCTVKLTQQLSCQPAFIISPWVGQAAVLGHDGIVVQPAAAAPVQTNLQGLHFDHTSVLETITRRFMATEPPLGARYAAANDLSVVLGSEMRQPQFLPFIPYNLEFGASQQLLTVAGANPAASGQTPAVPASGWSIGQTPSDEPGCACAR